MEQLYDVSYYKDNGILINSNVKMSLNIQFNYIINFEYECYEIIDNNLCDKDNNLISKDISSNSIKLLYSFKDQFFEFKQNNQIKGIEEAIKNIDSLNNIKYIIIKSNYAYGRYGLDSKNIKPNTNLFLKLKVIDFYDNKSLKNIERLKKEGVELFKLKNYSNAINKFNQSNKFILSVDNKQVLDSKDYIDLKLSNLINISNCYIKLKNFKESINTLREYVSINSNNVKAYYFLCICNFELYIKENNYSYIENVKNYYLIFRDLINKEEEDKEVNQCFDIYLNEIEELLNKANLIEDNKLKNKDIKKNKLNMFYNLYDDKKLIDKSISVPKGISPNNTKVFLEIETNTNYSNKSALSTDDILKFTIEIELFKDVCPKTCENFRVLCTGENQFEEGYNNFTIVDTLFFRFIKDFMMQGGDFENNDGSGGYSLYGKNFDDENFKFTHSEPGLLSMFNYGPNTNNSQFMITFNQTKWLNNKNVVFGRIINGFDYLIKLQNLVKTDDKDRPLNSIKVVSAGQIFKDIQ